MQRKARPSIRHSCHLHSRLNRHNHCLNHQSLPQGYQGKSKGHYRRSLQFHRIHHCHYLPSLLLHRFHRQTYQNRQARMVMHLEQESDLLKCFHRKSA